MVKPLIYSKQNCSNCEKTKNKFNILGIDYDIVDISTDREALKKIKAMGFKEAPVVVTGSESWSGYQEHKILHYNDSLHNDSDDMWDF